MICVFVHVALSMKTSIVIWLCGETLRARQSPFPLSRPPPASSSSLNQNTHIPDQKKSLCPRLQIVYVTNIFLILWIGFF